MNKTRIMLHITANKNEKPSNEKLKESVDNFARVFGLQIARVVSYKDTENGCLAELEISLNTDKVAES